MAVLILDASSFLSGKFTSLPANYQEVVTTSQVQNEIKKGSPLRNIDNLLSMGLHIRDPSSTIEAKKAASETGDLSKLSDADISIIALAMELGDPVVITDDFRIQNVLKSLGIRFEPAGEIGSRTIKEVWKWTLRCSGCGRYFEEPQKNDECPVCGSQVRKKRKR